MATHSNLSPSFPAQSPSPAPDEDPIQALANSHADSLAQCAALEALAQRLLVHDIDGGAQAAARELLRYFDVTVRVFEDCEERDLFPAFMESMAGSDAVCLRGMTEGLRDMIHAMRRRWTHHLRPSLLRIADGEPASLPSAELTAFSSDHAAYAQRCDTELLPMADRLLGDLELKDLRQALRARRAAQDGNPPRMP